MRSRRSQGKKRRGWAAAAGAATALWISAGSAGAVSPIELGAGQQPNVAVDATGAAHIAWNSHDQLKLRYCKLPAGASACDPVKELPVSDYGFARPYPFVSGSSLNVLTNRCCVGGSRTLLFGSGDGGGSFDDGTLVGDLNPSGDAVLGPGGGISMVTSALIATYFQRVPTDGSLPATANPALTNTYNYDGSVGIYQGKPVATFNDLTNTAFTINNGADPNNGANWSAPAVVAPGTQGQLASGPSGLFLLLKAPNNHLEVRKFNGTKFGPEAAIPGAVSGLAAIAEDPAGTLHVVWRNGNANPVELDYSRSTDGVNWSPEPGIVATDTGIFNLRLAIGPDGKGVAVWDRSADDKVAAAPVPPEAVGPPPTASFDWTPLHPCTGYSVPFDASTSTGGNPIVKYRWRFEPWGTLPSDFIQRREVETPGPRLTVAIPAYELESAGYSNFIVVRRPPVTASLTVIDSAGRTATATRQVAFSDDGFTIYFTGGWFGQWIWIGVPPKCRDLFTGPVNMAFAASKVTAAGAQVGVPLDCSSDQQCIGVIKASPVLRGSGAGSRRWAPVRRRAVGAAGKRRARVTGFNLTPGERSKVHVTLHGRGRKLLRHHRLKRVRVKLGFLSAHHKVRVRSKVMRVRYHRHGHKHAP